MLDLPCPSWESSNRDISTAQGILVGQAAWDLCNASFASKGIEKKKDHVLQILPLHQEPGRVGINKMPKTVYSWRFLFTPLLPLVPPHAAESYFDS